MTLRRMATVTASIKRAVMTNGKRGEPTVLLDGLKVTPFQPAGPELVLSLQLQTPHHVLETYLVGIYDVQTGDVLSIDGKDYPIRGVGPWTGPGRRTGSATGPFVHLVVEDVQL